MMTRNALNRTKTELNRAIRAYEQGFAAGVVRRSLPRDMIVTAMHGHWVKGFEDGRLALAEAAGSYAIRLDRAAASLDALSQTQASIPCVQS